jgi:hypothetical protein
MLENVLLFVFAGTSFEYESDNQKDQWFQDQTLPVTYHYPPKELYNHNVKIHYCTESNNNLQKKGFKVLGKDSKTTDFGRM